MAGDPQQNDDLENVWADLERELGPKRPRDDDAEPPLPGRLPQPLPRQGLLPEQPPAPPPQPTMRVRLPLYRPKATYVILAINIALWVVPALLDALGLGATLALPLAQLLRQGLPSTVRSFDPQGIGMTDLIQLLGTKENHGIYVDRQYYRLLTAMFLHGGIAHIAFNSYALYALGPESERLFGTWRFLAIYFVAGLAGSLASYAFNLSPALGASGAIFGLIGALGAFYYSQRELLGAASRAQLNSIVSIAGINLLIGFVLPGIDNWAHLGGLLFGGLAGLLLTPRFAIDRRFYPPQVVRLERASLALVVTLGLLAVEAALAAIIVPPL